VTEFSARTRAASLDAMAAEPLDVLVVGGGIVGTWIALTAALRGYRTGLVEKGDFASGTSGRTSRLVHGGLRYLQQFRLGVVRQAARERDVLLRIAPDLVKPLTFLLPVYRGRGAKGWLIHLGLWLYDVFSRDKVLPRCVWLSREEALGREPRLGGEGLVSGALYSDAITRDARLVVRVARAASEAGAHVANYARVTELVREDGRVRGAIVRDEETGRTFAVRASAVVNATGVWGGDLQDPARRLKLRPTKGIHALVPRGRVGNTGAVVLQTEDHRIVFVLPWGDLSLIGTTDTDYRGARDRVEADAADVDYLLRSVNTGFPAANLTRADVVGAYAGLRPLIDTGETRESDISRRHVVLEDTDGLLTVAGGKLTTGRAMAEDVLARVARRSPPKRRVDTRTISLAGGAVPEGDLAHQAAHCARHEMTLHVDDVLVRRLGLYHEREEQGTRIAPEVAEALGVELHWDAGRRARELARYREIVEAGRAWRTAHG